MENPGDEEGKGALRASGVGVCSQHEEGMEITEWFGSGETLRVIQCNPLPSESSAPNPSPDSLELFQGCSAQLDPPGVPSPAWAAPVQLCSFGMGVWG